MEQLKMTFEQKRANKTKLTRERLSQVCKLINAGYTPAQVCNQLKFSKHYFSMMIQCKMISVDENKNYTAMERIRNERYAMFLKLKFNYVKGIKQHKESPRVKKLKELIEKTNSVQTDEPTIVELKRSLVQRIIAKIFNL